MPFHDKLLPVLGAGIGFAAGGPTGAGLGLSIGSGIAQTTRGFPEFPISEDDINRLIDQRMNRALADVAQGTRRQLIGAGQEGSGSISQSIADRQQKVRAQFEQQREQALGNLRQQKFGRNVQSNQQQGDILSGLTDIGFSTFLLGGGLGGDQGQRQLSPIEQNFANQESLGIGNNPLPFLQGFRFPNQAPTNQQFGGATNLGQLSPFSNLGAGFSQRS